VKNTQLLYGKSLNLRAGELVKILLGEFVPFIKVRIRLNLESAPPKTLTIRAINSTDGKFVVNHVRADKEINEFDLRYEDDNERFNELHISVPEDCQFNLGIYLKN
jgi:hypothetical protein